MSQHCNAALCVRVAEGISVTCINIFLSVPVNCHQDLALLPGKPLLLVSHSSNPQLGVELPGAGPGGARSPVAMAMQRPSIIRAMLS